jgi:hypothetical protein
MNRTNGRLAKQQQQPLIKATSLQVIHFVDTTMKEPRPIILLYVLGEDGVVYEMAGGTWRGYPINGETKTETKTTI